LTEASRADRAPGRSHGIDRGATDMKKMLLSALAMAAFLFLGATMLIDTSDAQTPQGDVLRAQGRFLEGAGWYNLNTALADRINVETWKEANREVQRLYNDFLMDRYRHFQHNKNLGSKVQADVQRKFAEAQARWRTTPTPDDITSGDALNALASDLADPSIGPSSWRAAKVDLPSNMSLTSLAFKIADKKRSSLLQSTVAVDRMLVKGPWPLALRRSEVETECDAYKKSVTAVVEKCCKKIELKAIDVDRVRDAVNALAKKVESDVPIRDNQRTHARECVHRLDDATRIFAEQEYAEQLIRDVSEHHATTIAELLAFMRYYRLLFSDPGSSPEVADLYNGLYGLLRRQKEMLGMPTLSPQLKAEIVQRNEAAKLEGTWVLLRTRKDGQLKAASTKPAERVFLTFQGDRYTVKDANNVRQAGTWTLDASKTPKVLDREGVNAKKQPVKALGIYDWFNNEDLRICSSPTQRPSDLQTPPGSGRVLQVWGRPK
jgi:uncharacterized protein (TIGR03067 family)